MKKKFLFMDVMGVITQIIFRPQGFEGVGSILCFMTDENLDQESYGTARVDCLPELIKQFPSLNPETQKMKEALAERTRLLSQYSMNRDEAVKIWFEKLKNGEFGIEYSEFLQVSPIPRPPREAGIYYLKEFRGIGW